PFTSTNIDGGNIYTAQLSDAAGSFASAVNIGTLSGNASSGIISAVIPAGTSPGNAYRIRVVSSSPMKKGQDNGINIQINPLPTTSITGTAIFCAGSSTV